MNKPVFRGLVVIAAACAVLLFHAAAAEARQWHLLSHDQGATIYYDAASISTDRGVVKVWTRTDFDPPNLIGAKKETDDRALFAFRCRAREVGLASLLAYDIDGNEIARANESTIRFEQVEPLGPARALMKIACGSLFSAQQ
ncbi:surface-adhesin E family protein [Paraburkholderia bannensis]|uniref:surface-adhesin E family protein n=1 Tax=Paraburkholderia bannensis TaxID=765414 RepID=UPI002ABE3964|nr:surface-adhesin E family protein [Paraburkholderia bannensis]